MRKTVLILAPRLDCTFKKGPVPANRGHVPPIRIHWQNFIDQLTMYHVKMKHDTVRQEFPLWQLETEIEKLLPMYNPDVVYVPHKESHNFPILNKYGPLYYMQTVFPWLFTIDPAGWGAGMSISPIETTKFGLLDGLEPIKERMEKNVSKFDQPARKELPWAEEFIFFPCQIPHDETIKYHSDVEVVDALECTLRWAKENDKKVVVKGHPVNLGSCEVLRKKTKEFENAVWVTDFSIHDLLENCEAVFCVNSGVGIEAICHGKPVYHFGEAEYEKIATKVDNLDIDSVWKSKNYPAKEYDSWLRSFMEVCFDSTKPESFDKLG